MRLSAQQLGTSNFHNGLDAYSTRAKEVRKEQFESPSTAVSRSRMRFLSAPWRGLACWEKCPCKHMRPGFYLIQVHSHHE